MNKISSSTNSTFEDYHLPEVKEKNGNKIYDLPNDDRSTASKMETVSVRSGSTKPETESDCSSGIDKLYD